MKPNQSFAEYIHNRGTNLTRMRLEWEKLRQTQLWAADAEVFFEYMGLRIGDVQPIQAEGWVHGQSKVAVIGPYKYQCEGLFDPESGTRYIAFHQCPVTGKPDQKLSILVTRLEDRLSKVSSVHTNQVIDDKICHSPQELVREIALRMTERPELYAKAPKCLENQIYSRK
jgi:hypothetical protein